MKLKEFFKSKFNHSDSPDNDQNSPNDQNNQNTQNTQIIPKIPDTPTTPTIPTTPKLEIEEKILTMLKTVFDPEIPVNIYDLGLIYKIDLHDDMTLDVDMTMTAPNCPAADFIIEDVHQKLSSIDEIKEVNINLVFYPEWTKDMMSEEAKLELNML